MRRWLAYLAIGLVLATPAAAQDSDKGSLLGDLLEDTLSDDNRYIAVTGLTGGFSSRAEIEKLTVSDDTGVWLTIEDAVLDWNRLALVKGRFSVNELTAGRIVMARRPVPVPSAPDLPTPEATPFALPELPVAIEIAKIEATEIVLAEPVAGHAALLALSGAVTLADGALDTRVQVDRLDRPGDRLHLVAAFDNDGRQLVTDLTLREEAGGLVATALNIPDAPPVMLTVQGDGPLGDFTADVRLASAGIDRLTGQILLREEPVQGDGPAPTGFSADLSGDLRALLAPDYQPFFGPETRAQLRGRRAADGALALDQVTLSSGAMKLAGALDIAPGGAVRRAALSGRVSSPTGGRVILPLAGSVTRVERAQLSLSFDPETSSDWTFTARAEDARRGDAGFEVLDLQASGPVAADSGFVLTGRLSGTLSGIFTGDAALDRATGEEMSLSGAFGMAEDGTIAVDGFTLSGSDYRALTTGQISGLDTGFELQGTARVNTADLSRFAGLAGRPLAGSLDARLTGSGSPLGGAFDLVLTGTAEELVTGIKALDKLLPGRTDVIFDARRDAAGLAIEKVRLGGEAVQLDMSGTARSGATTLSLSASLDDLARVIPEAPGPIEIEGDLQHQGADWSGDLQAHGSHGSFARLSGTARADGTAEVTYAATLSRLERFAPEFPGDLSASGSATRASGLWQLDGSVQAPVTDQARLSGRYDETIGEADLNAVGNLRLGALNRLVAPISVQGAAQFDLRMKGAPGLDALGGTITASGLQVALPKLATKVTGLGGQVIFDGPQATLNLTGGLRNGGRFAVTGETGLLPPFNAGLGVALEQIVLTDHVSYDTVADGRLRYDGPLVGNGSLTGQVDFGETEINIATVGGSLSAAPIPQIAHVGEPAAARRTRARAGLTGGGTNGSGPDIGLDLVLNAPGKVFVRGRGLNAELGGSLHLRGSSQRVVPDGQITLIRGWLDAFSRRLELTEGLVTLQGKLEPYLEFTASSTSTEGEATLKIAGPLSAPEVTVTSNPPRPSEEALALLVFGNNFAELSPLKIAQMAVAFARLGGSGDGTVGKLREGLGVDNLDITADEQGNASVGVGTYLGENVYTDVTVNSEGESELNLNLDVTRDFRIKGTVDRSGAGGIGFYFERDF